MSLKIAIVGSGVSGLAALWALKNTGHEVHLFESENYFGGHVQTVPWKDTNGEKTMVDVAFALFNHVTYPNFCAFLSYLKIPVVPVKATFGLSRDDGQFEWTSTSLFTLSVRWRNIFSLELWKMLLDILRFNSSVSKVLDPTYPYRNESIGEFLHRHQYSKAFQNDYLIPLVSSLFVHNPQETMDSIPIIMVVKYLRNHQLLNVNPFRSSLQWIGVYGGASRYVDAILDDVPLDRLHRSSPVTAVHQHGKKLSLSLADRSIPNFDHVLLTTHATDSLRILGRFATEPLKEALGKFRFSDSTVFLHSDTTLMPRNRAAWSFWNYHGSASQGPVSLTADISYISSRPDNRPIFTSLNPYRIPHPGLTQGVFNYQHPIFDGNTLSAQNAVKSIQGLKNVWYAGAWLGYGFHEDGFTSGLRAAQMMCPELDLPFRLQEWDREKIHVKGWSHSVMTIFTFIVQSGLLLVTWLRRLYPVVQTVRGIKHRKDS